MSNEAIPPNGDNALQSPRDITMNSSDTYSYCGMQTSTIHSIILSCLNVH